MNVVLSTITREQAQKMMKTGEEVCFKYKGETICAEIAGTRGSSRATIKTNKGKFLVPYKWLVPKSEWKEDYTPKRRRVTVPTSNENYTRSNEATIKPIPKRALEPMHTRVKRMGSCLDDMRTIRDRYDTLEDVLNLSAFKDKKACVTENVQGLLDRLNDHYDIPKNKIRITGTRKKIPRGEKHGFYNTRTQDITVYPYTGTKNQVVANKTFLHTIVHEWNHHHDQLKLDLQSIHTSGFGKRVSTIYDQLKNVLE